jgi:cytidine deaminase
MDPNSEGVVSAEEAEEAVRIQGLIDPDHAIYLKDFLLSRPVEPWNPYSNFGVKALVECVDGGMYYGVNIENANYTLTKHAEEVAITQAIMDGAIERNGRAFIKNIVVACFGEAAPCGGCRQFISEFAFSGTVWLGLNRRDNQIKIDYFRHLLPLAFGPANLNIDV